MPSIRGTTHGVVALAIAGFAMSYDALHALAVEQGVPAALAWLWPLVVDGFIVVASLSVVRAIADGRRSSYAWILVLAFSGIPVAFNIMHAAPTLVARLVAAIPPAALVLSFELLMRQLRAALRPACRAAAKTHPHLIVAPREIRARHNLNVNCRYQAQDRRCLSEHAMSTRPTVGRMTESPARRLRGNSASPTATGVGCCVSSRLMAAMRPDGCAQLICEMPEVDEAIIRRWNALAAEQIAARRVRRNPPWPRPGAYNTRPPLPDSGPLNTVIARVRT